MEMASIEGEDVVIIGRKDINDYKIPISIVSRKNGGVTLKARGNNVNKAIQLSLWVRKVFGFVIEKTALEHIEYNGKDIVNQITIVMRKNKLYFALMPIFIFFKLLLGNPFDILFGTYMISGILDIIFGWS